MNENYPFMERVRRRWPMILILLHMMNRGRALSTQPFGVEVPTFVWAGFVVSAVALAWAVAIPGLWSDRMYVASAVAVGAPYINYVAWIAVRLDLTTGITSASAGDQLLVPFLVFLLWGRRRSIELPN